MRWSGLVWSSVWGRSLGRQCRGCSNLASLKECTQDIHVLEPLTDCTAWPSTMCTCMSGSVIESWSGIMFPLPPPSLPPSFLSLCHNRRVSRNNVSPLPQPHHHLPLPPRLVCPGLPGGPSSLLKEAVTTNIL